MTDRQTNKQTEPTDILAIFASNNIQGSKHTRQIDNGSRNYMHALKLKFEEYYVRYNPKTNVYSEMCIQ